jgi:hypothetical protein
MLGAPGMVDDIRAVLRESGIPETADGVITTLSGAMSSVRGGACADSTPQDGTIVDCDFERGTTLEWMAHRPDALRGSWKPARLEKMRWAGDKPFGAYLFTVTANRKVYTFVLPKVCGNLSLMSVKNVGVVAGAYAAPKSPCLNRRQRQSARGRVALESCAILRGRAHWQRASRASTFAG